MGLTVKTVKKKPLSLKKPDAEGVAAEAADGAAAPAAAPQAPAAQMKQPSYTFSGICGIVIFICFVTILILQYIEWDYYMQPKCAFPDMSLATGVGVRAPAAPVPDFVETVPIPDESL